MQNIEEILETCKPPIAIFNETFCEMNESVKINGYKTYSKTRNSRKGGGLCILIQDKWSAKCVEVKDESCEE